MARLAPLLLCLLAPACSVAQGWADKASAQIFEQFRVENRLPLHANPQVGDFAEYSLTGWTWDGKKRSEARLTYEVAEVKGSVVTVHLLYRSMRTPFYPRRTARTVQPLEFVEQGVIRADKEGNVISHHAGGDTFRAATFGEPQFIVAEPVERLQRHILGSRSYEVRPYTYTIAYPLAFALAFMDAKTRTQLSCASFESPQLPMRVLSSRCMVVSYIDMAPGTAMTLLTMYNKLALSYALGLMGPANSMTPAKLFLKNVRESALKRAQKELVSISRKDETTKSEATMNVLDFTIHVKGEFVMDRRLIRFGSRKAPRSVVTLPES